MKILMLTTSMDIGGAETHIAELCRGLKNMGYDVGVASAGGRYADELAAEGIFQYTLPLNKKSPLSVMRCRRELAKIIREEGYDIVHSHARIPGVVASSIQKKCGFRFTSTVHLDFAVNFLWRRITKWGEATIAVSDDLCEYLVREYGVERDRVSVTVNGIDMTRFAKSDEKRRQIREEFSVPHGDRLVVYISRLDEDRSAPAKLLCQVWPTLLETHPNTTLLIVGNGNDYGAVQAAADRANSNSGKKGVILAGTRYDIDRFCGAADIFCGVSRSALEAMSAEVPVILSGNQGHMGIFTSDSLTEAISTNFCCRGCAEPTGEKLLRDVRTLLDLPVDELRFMGVYNRSVVKENYSLDKMCGDYAKMYENLLKDQLFQGAETVISGFFGYGNLGDEFALDCLANSIRSECPGIKISVLSRNPKKFGKAHGMCGVGRYNLFAMIRKIRRADLLISGGGSLFQNSTSLRSLRYYAGVVSLAHFLGTPVCICANGVGPIRGRRAERIVRSACLRACGISVRDTASKNTLIKIGVPPEGIRVSADPVFCTVFDDLPHISELKSRIGMRNDERYMALSLRGAMWDEKARRELCRGVRQVYLTRGLVPLFISMQKSEDDVLCRIVAEESCGEGIVVPPLGRCELAALLRECEVTVSMRLHLLILSASVGIPFVGIGDDPKLQALTDDFGMPLSAVDDVSGESFGQLIQNAAAVPVDNIIKAARDEALLAENDGKWVSQLLRGEAFTGVSEGDRDEFSNIIREN